MVLANMFSFELNAELFLRTVKINVTYIYAEIGPRIVVTLLCGKRHAKTTI